MNIKNLTRGNDLFLFCAAALTVLTILVGDLALSIDFDARLMLQILAAVFAFFSGTFILTRYLARRDLPFLFLGLTFFAAAFVEILNDFFLGRFVVGAQVPIESEDVWVWHLTRWILLLSMVLAALIWRNRPGSHLPRAVHIAFAFLLGIVIISLDVIGIRVLTDLDIGGVYLQGLGLITGLAFLSLALATTVLPGWNWEQHPILRSVSYFLLLSAFADFAFAQTITYGDPAFAIALLLKVFSFILPFIGASKETINLYRERDEFDRQLEAQNVEIREVNKSFQQEAAKLKAVIEQSPIGVFVARADDGKPTMWNKRTEELLGRIIDPKVGASHYVKTYRIERPDGTPYPTDDLPFVRATRDGVVVKADDMVIRRAHGGLVRLSVHASPIHDEEGKITGAVLVFEDVTEEKKLEQLKSEFVSIVSHQLKSPITALNWYVEDLEDKHLPVSAKESVKSIEAIGRHMNDLVANLLSLSRLETGRLQIVPEIVDLPEITRAVIESSRLSIQEKKISISLNGESNGAEVFCDPRLMTEIVQNLINNAVRYSKVKGKIEVNIKKDGQWITCTVIDQGIGIPADEQKGIFQRFYRATNAKNLVPDGNGLGLYIAKSFVETCGGTIDFVSEEGKGSSFWIKLKAAKRYHKEQTK